MRSVSKLNFAFALKVDVELKTICTLKGTFDDSISMQTPGHMKLVNVAKQLIYVV